MDDVEKVRAELSEMIALGDHCGYSTLARWATKYGLPLCDEVERLRAMREAVCEHFGNTMFDDHLCDCKLCNAVRAVDAEEAKCAGNQPG